MVLCGAGDFLPDGRVELRFLYTMGSPVHFLFLSSDSEDHVPGLSDSAKNIRGPTYIGVIHWLHPQKLPFLQIYINYGTALE